jgi:hypothetical protein
VSNRGSVLFSARTTRDCDVEELAPPGTPIERNRGRTGHGDGEGVMQWVTRARPKVDRIDCPWLIKRLGDPDAEFLLDIRISHTMLKTGRVLRSNAADSACCHQAHRK